MMFSLKFLKNTLLIITFILVSFFLGGDSVFAANKYWVGGGASSNWNATGNTNWSLTSGGANNAAVPTGTDVAIFDNNSGTGTPVLNSGSVLPASITFTNYAGNFTQSISLNKPVTFDGFSGTYTQSNVMSGAITFTNFSGVYTQNASFTSTSTNFTGFSGIFNNNSTIQGSAFDLTGFSGVFNQNNNTININTLNVASTVLKFSATMTYNITGINSALNITPSNCALVSCTILVTTAGKIMPKFNINTNSKIIVSLQDDFVSNGYFWISQGVTFNTNNHNLSAHSFAASPSGTLSEITTINLGSSTFTITLSDSVSDTGFVWIVDGGTNMFFNAGTSTIKFTDATSDAKTLMNYITDTPNIFNNLWFSGSGPIYLAGASSYIINDLRVDNPPRSINFPIDIDINGFVSTINSLNINGISGTLNNLNTEQVTSHTLSKSSGTVSVDYLNIANSIATGGATWYAGANSIDGGGNTGWIFAPTLSIQPATVGTTTATLNGTITATGGENASTRGFQYGPDTSYGTTTTESGSFSTGAYTSDITGLTCNTTYHVRSYATNGSGTHYSSDTTFTTSACPVTSRNYGRPITSQTPTSIPLVTPIPTVNTTPTVTTTPTPTTPTAIFTRDLKLRMKGDDVKYLQEYLNKNNYASPMLIIDGIYGSKTRQAVIKLQKANSLLPDGIVGEKTRGVINTE